LTCVVSGATLETGNSKKVPRDSYLQTTTVRAGAIVAITVRRSFTLMAKKLYVGNLSYNTDDASLEAAFSADGRSVLSARVITDRDTGRSRGFGFVEFDDDGDATAAMEAMDGQDLDGRTLRVNEANDRR